MTSTREFKTTLWSGRLQWEIPVQESEVTNSATHLRDKNNLARLLNSRLSLAAHRLEPFYGADGEVIPNFLKTGAELNRLNSKYIDSDERSFLNQPVGQGLSQLSIALGLSTEGNMSVRMAKVKKYIGMTLPDT